jgi:hypothetical protein
MDTLRKPLQERRLSVCEHWLIFMAAATLLEDGAGTPSRIERLSPDTAGCAHLEQFQEKCVAVFRPEFA